VAQASLLYADVNNLSGFNEGVLTQVEEFLVNYLRVYNITVTILGRPTAPGTLCVEAVALKSRPRASKPLQIPSIIMVAPAFP
jgi:hypothetical protein